MPHATGLGPISPHRGRCGGRSAFAARQRRDEAEHAVLRGRLLARPFGSREQHTNGISATHKLRSAHSPHTIVRSSEHGLITSKLTPVEITGRSAGSKKRPTPLSQCTSSTVEDVIAARKSLAVDEKQVLQLQESPASSPPAGSASHFPLVGIKTMEATRQQEDKEKPDLVVKLRIRNGASLSRGGERRDHGRSPLGGSAWNSIDDPTRSIKFNPRRRQRKREHHQSPNRGVQDKGVMVIIERKKQCKSVPVVAVDMAGLFAVGSSTLPSESRENSARCSRTRERWKDPGASVTSSSTCQSYASTPTEFGIFVRQKRTSSPNYPEFYERDNDDIPSGEGEDMFPPLSVPGSSQHLIRSHANISRSSLGTSGRLMEAHRRCMETMKFRSMTGSPNTGKRDRKEEREARRRKQEARAQRLMLELKQTLADKQKYKRLLASENRLFTAEFELRAKLSKPLPSPTNCHVPTTCHPRLHPSSPSFSAFFPLVADHGAADDLGRALSHNRLSQYVFNKVGPPPPQLAEHEARSLQRDLLESRNRKERERLSGAFRARMGGMDDAVEVMNETLDLVAHRTYKCGKHTGVLLEEDIPQISPETHPEAQLPAQPPAPLSSLDGRPRVTEGETAVMFSCLGLPKPSLRKEFRKPKTFYPTKVQQDALWGYHREEATVPDTDTSAITTDAEAEEVYSMLFSPAR